MLIGSVQLLKRNVTKVIQPIIPVDQSLISASVYFKKIDIKI